jgi:hypothetical protein
MWSNQFKMLKIIFNLMFMLSSHIFLLRMLFKTQTFKFLSVNFLEKLYSLNILDSLNEQALSLYKIIIDDFIFCKTVCDAYSVHVLHQLQLTSTSVQYCMKKSSQITDFAQITKLYILHNETAKTLNKSCKCLTLRCWCSKHILQS